MAPVPAARVAVFTVHSLVVVVAVAAFFAAGSAASAQKGDFPEVYRRESFLMQALLQAEVGDFFGDGRTGLAVSGRNYETNETYVHVLYWNGAGFDVVWRSPNLWEPASHVAIAAGDFTGAGRTQIAVLSDERLRLFQWDGAAMVQIHEQPGVGAPAEIGVVRHPNHPYDLIAVSRRQGVDLDYIPRKSIELIGWLGGRFRPLWETEPIGRVRALAGGDLTGDGFSEIIAEVGNGMGPGTVQIWAWQDGEYRRLENAQLRSAPAFGLAAVPGRPLLVVADDRGRAAAYEMRDRLEFLGESPSLGWAVASAAAGDFFGDGGIQAVVIGYPSRLHVLQIEDGQ